MYTWDPEDYRRSSSEQQRWARELIATLGLTGREAILDIGCGDGKVSAELASMLRDGVVLGIDSSEGMISLARETFRHAVYPNLTFELKDAGSLDFDEEFDIVFSNAALHWIIDHRPLLRGIRRSLKPHGRLVAQMGGKGNANDMVKTVTTVIKARPWRRYFTRFSFPWGFHGADEYREWLLEAGLRPVRVGLIPKDMAHRGKEGLAAWFRTTFLPYTQRVPEDERSSFIAGIIDRYIEEHPLDAEGFVHVGMVRLEVEAAKM